MAGPCKGCEDRVAVPNCHSTCERFLQWESEHNAERERRNLQKKYDYDAVGYVMQSAARLRKKFRSKRKVGDRSGRL